jgi:hypothetical protein
MKIQIPTIFAHLVTSPYISSNLYGLFQCILVGLECYIHPLVYIYVTQVYIYNWAGYPTGLEQRHVCMQPVVIMKDFPSRKFALLIYFLPSTRMRRKAASGKLQHVPEHPPPPQHMVPDPPPPRGNAAWGERDCIGDVPRDTGGKGHVLTASVDFKISLFRMEVIQHI